AAFLGSSMSLPSAAPRDDLRQPGAGPLRRSGCQHACPGAAQVQPLEGSLADGPADERLLRSVTLVGHRLITHRH
ncbi:MAG: hypothetical protein JSW31_04460, partial [Burkholderiales bacterium]